MTTSKVDIYNIALFNIGHTTAVTSTTEDSIERQNCDAVYEQKKKSLLAGAQWGFAKTYVSLSLTGNTPPGWAYEYHYPNGCVRAIEIARDSDSQPKIPFQRALMYDDVTGAEKAVIWTDEQNARLIYIRNVQSPDVFTLKFIDTLTHYMAIDLARVMAKTKQVVDDMKSLFTYHMNEAIRMGEAEAEDKPEQEAEWIKDR